MAMTKTERVILLNQFRMLAKLDPNEKDYYNRSAKALQYGFTSNYDFLEHLSPELSQDDCRLLLQALDMHEAMQTSWTALADKCGISAQQIAYRGFDGNNETQHMSYSQFIVEDCERFTYLGIRDHNSHMEMIPGYLRMLEKWAEFEESHKLKANQLQALIAASHYPG